MKANIRPYSQGGCLECGKSRELTCCYSPVVEYAFFITIPEAIEVQRHLGFRLLDHCCLAGIEPDDFDWSGEPKDSWDAITRRLVLRDATGYGYFLQMKMLGARNRCCNLLTKGCRLGVLRPFLCKIDPLWFGDIKAALAGDDPGVYVSSIGENEEGDPRGECPLLQQTVPEVLKAIGFKDEHHVRRTVKQWLTYTLPKHEQYAQELSEVPLLTKAHVQVLVDKEGGRP